MRKISLWARCNPAIAITLLIVCKVILILTAITLGRILLAVELTLPYYLPYISLAVLLICSFAYPVKKGKLSSLRYHARKSCDLLIGSAAFVSILFTATQPDPLPSILGGHIANAFVIRPGAEQLIKELKEDPSRKLNRSEKRILKKEFKKQLGNYAKATVTGKKDDARQSLYILLVILGALGLLYLVAALSCELSCSGAEGAAVVVAVVGAIGITWAAIALIKKISRKKTTPETPE